MRYLPVLILPVLFFIAEGCQTKKSGQAKQEEHVHDVFTCPMHPEIVKNEPGSCPICGMDLVKKGSGGEASRDVELEALLKPTNEFVLSGIPLTALSEREVDMETQALGTVTYDTRMVGSIASRVAGRIERLYVRHRFQKVNKGQRILDIYSPELVTAQQNLLFLLREDPENAAFIRAAREKLLLLGMSEGQLQEVIRSGKASQVIAVYSSYAGHIHESLPGNGMAVSTESMGVQELSTVELSLKEGMYVEKGQTVFSVFNPDRSWVVLNIYGENQGLVKKGDVVRIVPEAAPDKDFRATIDYVEPFYREGGRTLTARVYFDNRSLRIPVGSQVRATVFGKSRTAKWLPKESLLSLGLDDVVFLRTGQGFVAHKVNKGIQAGGLVEILSGLGETDSVAVNAQFLMDSESFIKTKSALQ